MHLKIDGFHIFKDFFFFLKLMLIKYLIYRLLLRIKKFVIRK